MKLCIIANPNSIHTHRWVRYFVKRGHDVHLISPIPLRHSAPEGITLHPLSRVINVRKLRYLIWSLTVRRLVHRIQPDLLHAHGATSCGWLGAAADYHPFVVSAHGSDLLLLSQRPWLWRRFSIAALQRADYVTCVSGELAHRAQMLGVAPTRIETVPLGVDTRTFSPSANPESIRTRLNLLEHPVVLSIRAISPVYNSLDIARAIPLVHERLPLVQFVIRTYNADPSTLAQFRAIVQEHDVTKAVRYVDELSDEHAIANYYRAAHVAVSIPSSDGTPNSVLEAMACGTPVILSDLPTLREWVRHEEEGLFVPVGDAGALSAAIVRLLTDHRLRTKLSANGVSLVRQHADSEVWMRHSERIYELLTQ